MTTIHTNIIKTIIVSFENSTWFILLRFTLKKNIHHNIYFFFIEKKTSIIVTKAISSTSLDFMI